MANEQEPSNSDSDSFPSELNTIPQEILALDDWTSLGTGTSKVAAYNTKMFQYIRALCAKVKQQSNEIKELQQKVSNLEQKQKAETEAPVLQTWSMMVSGKKQSEQQQVLIASVNKELREKERIENNVIISGIGAGNSDDQDLAKVDEVLQALKLDRGIHVKSQRRIKTNRTTRAGNPIDMIVVEFKDETAKNTALRGAKTLSTNESLKKVYINPDKTPSERVLEVTLRTARDEKNKSLTHVKDGTEGRHRYGILPAGHPKADKKYYWGIRWNELRQIIFD